MATRRKYARPGYFRGGSVPEPALADVPIEGDAADHLADDQVAEEEHHQVPPPEDDGPLGAAVRAAVRANELARLSPIEREIAALPISSHKKAFLMANPALATDAFLAKATSWHHQQGLAGGLDDDSAELDQYILEGLGREIANREQLAVQNARQNAMQPEPRPKPQPAPLMPQPQAAAPVAPAVRRGIPMSAPVSRDVPSASGVRRPGPIHLNADERMIARSSFPHLKPDQAEWEYGKNKRLMLERKASGEIG